MKTKVREKSRYNERAGWMNRKISCVQTGRKECSNTAALVRLCGFSQPEKEKKHDFKLNVSTTWKKKISRRILKLILLEKYFCIH